MDLHHHSGHAISQLETLLAMHGQYLDRMTESQSFAAQESCIQHLRNATELITRWSIGADEALTGLLYRLAGAEAEGRIARDVLDSILQPCIDALGEQYTHAAMDLSKNT